MWGQTLAIRRQDGKMGSIFSPGTFFAPFFRASGSKPIEAGPLHPAEADAPPFDDSLLLLCHADRVALAFSEVELSPNERTALRALLDHPGSTGTELSALCGWTETGWMNRMLLICQRRRRFLWPEGIGTDATKAILIGALASYNADTLRFRPREDVTRVLVNTVAGVAS